MRPKPWIEAIPQALFILLGGLIVVELQAKVSEYGWKVETWPVEITFLSESHGHAAFFLLFIIPVMFAGYLAIARHGEEHGE